VAGQSVCKRPRELSHNAARTVAKRAFYVLFFLSVCTVVAGFVDGFTTTVHARGIACGTSLRVVDGTFASGVPNDLKDACQSAANRRIGYTVFPFFAFFVPTLVLAFVLHRRGALP
jgi:hypothetical protein